MTSITSQKQMILTSDTPIDKIVLLKSGSFTLPGSSSAYVTPIPHGLPFTPLCSGNWSTVSNFSIQYEFSSGTYPSSNPGYVFNAIMNVYADSTNIYIDADNIGSSMTVYYRVFGFEPASSLANVPAVASQGDVYMINSDYLNPKLYLNGSVNLPATSGSEVFTYVQHDIGTIPQVMGWVTYSTFNGSGLVNAVHPVGTSNYNSQGVTLIVGEAAIAFSSPPFIDAHTAYYRIYLDE